MGTTSLEDKLVFRDDDFVIEVISHSKSHRILEEVVDAVVEKCGDNYLHEQIKELITQKILDMYARQVTLQHLAKLYLSSYLLSKIVHHHSDLHNAWSTNDSKYNEIKRRLIIEWIIYAIVNAFGVLSGAVVCLFSISAVAYVVGCFYVSVYTTYIQVMRFVVFRAWKRLVITFLWYFIILGMFGIGGTGFLIIGSFVMGIPQLHVLGIIVQIIISILYIIGVIYISMIWNTASVMSVLESKYYGLSALERSRVLMKGKMKAIFPITFIFEAWLYGTQAVFFVFLAKLSLETQVVTGIFCFLVTSTVVLMGLVVQTVIYLVCKSYHQETMDEPWMVGQ
ncbi:hypothetical protein Syun_014413 [Stephania yunnanensis]|uniref:Uncharacterized protein n=1 Tax=Stephania yunnanensis TaxID=152371 RepID=A0AAP0P8J7_9MAGN